MCARVCLMMFWIASTVGLVAGSELGASQMGLCCTGINKCLKGRALWQWPPPGGGGCVAEIWFWHKSELWRCYWSLFTAKIKRIYSVCCFPSRSVIRNKYNVSVTQHFILYALKIVYCQGDMFRCLLGHLQVLWENRSKNCLCFDALCEPKSLQIVVIGKENT